MALTIKDKTALIVVYPALLLPFLAASITIYYWRSRVPFWRWESASGLMRIMGWFNLLCAIHALTLGLCTYHCTPEATTGVWASFRLCFNIMRVAHMEHFLKSWPVGRAINYALTVTILVGFGLVRFYYVGRDTMAIPLVWMPYLALTLIFFSHAGRVAANKQMSLFERRASRDSTPLLALAIVIITTLCVVLFLSTEAQYRNSKQVFNLILAGFTSGLQVSA
jgi:hypothetical protein